MVSLSATPLLPLFSSIKILNKTIVTHCQPNIFHFHLYSVSHEPQMVPMPIPYPFALKVKYYTPLQGKSSMFYILP
jgi:hypothetical protein